MSMTIKELIQKIKSTKDIENIEGIEDLEVPEDNLLEIKLELAIDYYKRYFGNCGG